MNSKPAIGSLPPAASPHAAATGETGATRFALVTFNP